MKKLLTLAVIAIFAFSVSSCIIMKKDNGKHKGQQKEHKDNGKHKGQKK